MGLGKVGLGLGFRSIGISFYTIGGGNLREGGFQRGIPLTSTWPNLRCDVGVEEGEYREILSLCYSSVYYYNGEQRYEQFLQVGRLYLA